MKAPPGGRCRLIGWALLFALVPSAASADGVIDNVNGYTLDASGALIRFNGLVINHEGRVARLLNDGDKRPSQPDFRLDGSGRTLLPGLIDTRQRLSLSKAPLPREHDLVLQKVQDRLLASGTTAVSDMGTTIADWLVLRRAADRGQLRIRVMAYAQGLDPLLAIAGTKPTPWLYNSHLRMAAVMLVASNGKTPAIKARLRNQMSRAAMDGFQIALLAPGPAETIEAQAAVEELAWTYGDDRRWRIETATPTPSPFAALLAQLHMLSIDRPKPIAQALTTQTSAAARLNFADDRIGLLMPGYHADFILIDRDILASAGPEASLPRVIETWVGGQRVWAAP